MIKIKIKPENIFLLIFLTFILFLGPGRLFDHQLQHDFPFGYGASDAFQHQVRAEAIKDAGNFKYEASYISKGFEEVIGRYPPLLYHLAVIQSHATQSEVYDTIYFIVVFFPIIASLIAFLIIRNYNKTVALISLPLTLLLYSSPILTGMLWGHWPSILSQCFLVFLFWAIMRINLKYSFIFITLALTATILTHTSETFFGIIFLAIFFGIQLITKKLTLKHIKTMVISAILVFIISFYYLVIFQNTFAAQGYNFSVYPIWDGNPGFYIGGFGLLLIPMILGITFALIKILKSHIAIVAAVAMLINGFLNYVGFEVRSFQIRFFWPLYLSIFLGLGIYTLLKFVIKKWNIIYTAAIFIILLIFIGGFVKLPILKQTDVQRIPYIPYINAGPSPGIMNPFHWESLKWLSDETDPDSRILFFYGDIYSQDALLRNSKRFHYQIEPDSFIKDLQEKKIKRHYVLELPGDNGGSIKIRNSFFNFEQTFHSKPEEYYYGPQDICTFDYLILDKASRQQVLAQYNILIANELIRNEFIEPKFENKYVVILKNNNLGEDCIEEKDL